MTRLVQALAVPLGLTAAALLAVVVAASGAFPVRASSGHWPWTEAFLSFGARRSIATWSAGVDVPPLDEPALALQGAGHYEIGCAPCHGAPGEGPPAFSTAMSPPPPPLPGDAAAWDPEDLFYVVQHGIKFTGMPGWPDPDRDDEVWAMVAFLRAPVALEAARPVPDVVAGCARCHGADGLGRGAPRLAGQREAYLLGALRAYAARERSSGTMQLAVGGLSDAELVYTAAWYAGLPPGPAWDVAGADLTRGEAVAHGRTGEPACVACHGPTGGAKDPGYPRLVGQDPAYLVRQFERFRAGSRGGSPYAPIMALVAGHGLDRGEIEDVAGWYAGQD